ncbi:MAG: hypothetical protein EZS28_011561 [Streblomastix strix]|uniref:Reverse transcriptase domain-containing protein n=1 Tax=Streblomastix strix TaxID=222440 RepID=A0A5J4WE19_9EUKA|nr:MAG: hypothetical protein EZS28_011561 [Streblomastix strix]
MVEPYIPDKETQWNIEKSSGCEQVEQRNRETTLQIHGLVEFQYLANQIDYAASLDLKSAFHHFTVSSNSILYLEFNFNRNNYTFKAMPIGTKNSPIFFGEAIESIFRQIRIHSEIKILNYCDDILLIHQDKQTLKTQTKEIMKTLEQFQWTNINREIRNRTEIFNNVHRMDMKPEGNDYKNIREKNAENDAGIERLVQRNIQEQRREDKIINSDDGQVKFPLAFDKIDVAGSNGI